MSAPIVQGWCPGAYKPMMSGDGLVVRIRPVAAEISSAQAKGIAKAAKSFGNGFIDLTNRANLQIRGVSEESYPPLMQALDDLGLLDQDPAIEPRRNIVLAPFYAAGDMSHRLYTQLVNNLGQFPDFPGKFGFAIDCAPKRILTQTAADIRFEQASSGGLILRAEGCETGMLIDEDQAVEAALDLVQWFLANRSDDIRRMPKLLRQIDLPARFQGHTPVAAVPPPAPGATHGGTALAVPFGQMAAEDLVQLASLAPALRVTPWRSLWLQGLPAVNAPNLITSAKDPRVRIDACAGKPYCPQASVETRGLALRLAGRVLGHLHVAGCAKGCTHPGPADCTLVGRDGRFDLVQNGTAWDEPSRTGLSLEEILEMDLT